MWVYYSNQDNHCSVTNDMQSYNWSSPIWQYNADHNDTENHEPMIILQHIGRQYMHVSMEKYTWETFCFHYLLGIKVIAYDISPCRHQRILDVPI